MAPGPKNAKSLLKFSKNSAGQIVPKIKILRARYEVKSPLPNGFLSLLASNSNAYSCARPRTKFEGHTVICINTCILLKNMMEQIMRLDVS